MTRRLTRQLAAIVAAAAAAVAVGLGLPAAGSADKGGHPHSTKPCPPHKHHGKHKGSGHGKKKGSGKGKKCGKA
jgi:hypothetical protein